VGTGKVEEEARPGIDQGKRKKSGCRESLRLWF